MKVLLVAVELASDPDSAVALTVRQMAKALSVLGNDVRVLVPGPSADGTSSPWRTTVSFPDGALHEFTVGQSKESVGGVPAWVASCPTLPVVSGSFGHPYEPVACVAFCRAAARWIAESSWTPDVVHCWNWPVGLLPLLLRQSSTPSASSLPCVFAIPNAADQGNVSPSLFGLTDLDASFYSPKTLEFFGTLGLLKAGIVFADVVTTLSPTYAAEVLTPAFGCGLEGVLQSRSDRLFGILGGIDDATPEATLDRALARPCAAAYDPEVKLANKRLLLERLGHDRSLETAPLFGFVGRFNLQKGVDLLMHVAEAVASSPAGMVVVAVGDKSHEETLRAISRLSDRIAVHFGYDESLAHQALAGCDIQIIPSRFEPCGIFGLSGLRCGTVPLAARVGALADAVQEFDPRGLRGNGFLFEPGDAGSLKQAMGRALATYAASHLWAAATRNARRSAPTWTDAANRYLDVYAIAQRYARARQSTHAPRGGNP